MNFLELYVGVDGNSSVQCISYHSCCVNLEYRMPQFYSPLLGSNRPTASDSFASGPVRTGLEYSGNHRKKLHSSFHGVHIKRINSCKRRDIRYT